MAGRTSVISLSPNSYGQLLVSEVSRRPLQEESAPSRGHPRNELLRPHLLRLLNAPYRDQANRADRVKRRALLNRRLSGSSRRPIGSNRKRTRKHRNSN